MTLLQPLDAPLVHIEQLPANSFAAVASVVYDTLSITTWSPSARELSFTSGSGDDAFVERYCEDCEFYVEEMEWNDSPEISTDHGYLYIRGSYYTESPCNAYSSGIGDVELPCAKGYEMNEEEGDVTGRWLTYTNQFSVSTMQQKATFAFQQGAVFKGSSLYLTDSYECINVFNDYRICWGGNRQGSSLLEIENIFTVANGNDDLCSPERHAEQADDIEGEYDDICDDEEYAGLTNEFAVPLPTGQGRGKSLVVATALTHTSAFLLLGASGARINNTVAYVPVQHYSNVAVTDDYVCNVWATDVLPCGKRLLFANDQLLGQVNPDFSLEPCTSPKQPSSALEAPDNNCCPA